VFTKYRISAVFKGNKMKIWKNCGGVYEVSNEGDVRSCFGNYKILKPLITNRGYLSVKIYVDCIQETHRIHRLVALAFIPNPFNLESVNHKDCNKLNNHVDNLEWMTKLENYQHAKENDLLLRGEDHQNSKLKEEDVVLIKYMISDGTSHTDIANLFKLSQGTISQIAKNKTWLHISWPAGYIPLLENQHCKGSSMKTAILDEESVRKIRELYSKGETQVNLAKMFGVTRGTMSQLILRKTWKHVE
jgi:plasmid maintenance system antidote protein VapI